MDVDLVERLVDVAGLITDDFKPHIAGKLRPHLLEPGLHALDDGDGVGAGLPPHVEAHGRHAVEPRNGALLLGAILGASQIAHADGRTLARGDDEIAEGFRIRQAAQRAQGLLAQWRGDVAAGDVGVLPLDGRAHGGDGDLVGGQAVGIQPHVDGALQSADDFDLTHAGGALDLDLDDFIGQLSQLAGRARAGHGEGQHGRELVVVLGNRRRIGVAREVAHHGGDAVAHVLRGGFDVAVQIKGDDDKRTALAADGGQFLDAFNGVDGFLNGLGDLRFHLGG